MDDTTTTSSCLVGEKSPWRPAERAFHRYSPVMDGGETSLKQNAVRLVSRKPLVAKLTKDIVKTYQTCNPDFKHNEELNPKRFLTTPSVGISNGGYDNENSDLILSVNFVLLHMGSQRRYIVKEMLGHGTFGQVAKCWVEELKRHVALKIIKNQPAYYQQALVEVSILWHLNTRYDPEDKHHIVRILDYFEFQNHLCISFELLGSNLYELMKMNNFRGLSMNIVQVFARQILRALVLMKDANIIHCDLKPENILLCTRPKPGEIKIIDFGSACKEDRTVYSYIQSRYYRSPEVLLGYQYNTAIDMWSFGCIVAELFLGLPLFPGMSEFDLLRRMITTLGGQPPDHVLKEAKNTAKFFKRIGSGHNFGNDEICMGERSGYHALTAEEYEARTLKKATVGKQYFKYTKLEEVVKNYPYRNNLPQEEMSRETINRLAMIDFLRGLIEFDPAKRWSPLQASKHPFVTGEPFTSPYRPPPETPHRHVPVAQNIKVDHHPGGGHWFAAGLSPQVLSINRGPPQNSFQVAPQNASSYGSLGSYGSYNEGVGLGSSYGSYGDESCVYPYYSPVGPSGLNIRTQGGGVPITGASSDARWRTSQLSHGNGGLGVSPSAGNFGPMSLGASPSQFTPPNHHISSGSPGKFGPTSPARGSVHGSPLSKMAAVGHFNNRRRSWGHPGSHSLPSQEDTTQWQGHHTDGASCSYGEGSSRGHSSGSPRNMQSTGSIPNWRHQRGNARFTSGFSSGTSQSVPQLNSNLPYRPSLETTNEKAESSSLPDPGDWDPNYSDELLLQEDGPDLGSMVSEFTNVMRISHPPDSTVPFAGLGRFNNTYQTHMNSHIPNQRNFLTNQAYPQVDAVSSSSAQDMHVGHGRPLMSSQFTPHSAQSSPSRFGQHSQPCHRSNHVPSNFARGGEWNQQKVQPPPIYNNAGSHSLGNSALPNGSAWGRRPGYPMTDIPPASNSRKDYGRIV